jgi:hypothetical protein
MTDKVYYEARGRVRGSCGHRHRSILTACKCVNQDYRACRKLGGGAYSDRVVRRLDGEPLSEAEDTEVVEVYYHLERGY